MTEGRLGDTNSPATRRRRCARALIRGRRHRVGQTRSSAPSWRGRVLVDCDVSFLKTTCTLSVHGGFFCRCFLFFFFYWGVQEVVSQRRTRPGSPFSSFLRFPRDSCPSRGPVMESDPHGPCKVGRRSPSAPQGCIPSIACALELVSCYCTVVLYCSPHCTRANLPSPSTCTPGPWPSAPPKSVGPVLPCAMHVATRSRCRTQTSLPSPTSGGRHCGRKVTMRARQYTVHSGQERLPPWRHRSSRDLHHVRSSRPGCWLLLRGGPTRATRKSRTES